MHPQQLSNDPTRLIRPAGILYLIIILLGLGSEIFVRSALVVPGDPPVTAGNILANLTLFRTSLAADAVMALADVALAVLLFLILRPVSPLLATLAAVFRLVQTSVISGNLLNQQSALTLLDVDPDLGVHLAYQALELHGFGYDLGLIFFGVSSLLIGRLLMLSRDFASVFGWLMMAAGAVYLAGSFLRILAPEVSAAFAPAYGVAIIAESALCLRLLTHGMRQPRHTVTA